MPWRLLSASGFFCPACRHGLRISAAYLRVLYLLSGAASCLLAYAVGMRREPLFVVTFLAWWPVYMLVVRITVPLFPPDLEATGDYRGILYESLDHQGEFALRSQALPTTTSEPVRMFQGVGARRPVGELVFAALALLLVVFAAWFAVRPLAYRIFPEIGATYQGPTTFPIRLHIGRSSLGIANGSRTPWTCSLELGVWTAYSGIAVIDAQRSQQLQYSAFTPSANTRGLTPETAAREQIRAECSEPNGIVHMWITR